MALKAGQSCPEKLLRGLRQGQNVFELIQLQSTLQSTRSCSVCLGWLLGVEERSLCVVKSYQKYKLDDAQLLEVREALRTVQWGKSLMLLFFMCTWAGRSRWL
jgi:hypothetical protein